MSGRTLYAGGHVLACDGNQTPHEALVTEGGRIVGLGTRAAMGDLVDRSDAVVDLEGATLLPGLLDTHPHGMHFAALKAALVDLSDARDHDDIGFMRAEPCNDRFTDTHADSPLHGCGAVDDYHRHRRAAAYQP